MSIMSTARGRARLQKQVVQTGPKTSGYIPLDKTHLNNFTNAWQAGHSPFVDKLIYPAANVLKHHAFLSSIPTNFEQITTAPPTRRTDFPIERYRAQFKRAVRLSDTTILLGETGVGKSILAPQFLLEQGFDQVIVTEPRRIVTSSLAGYGAKLMEERVGGTIGFRNAYQEAASKDTRLIYVTDGHQLMRELHKASGKKTAVVLDEIHEFNPYMESLLALQRKRQLNGGGTPKLIIMSATMDTEGLSKHFGGAPVINVKGRKFNVEERARGVSKAYDAALAAAAGESTLVFHWGMAEIKETEAELRTLCADAKILRLHSKMTREEQDKVLKKYSRPKIILATPLAQTGVTINDIDGVILSGYIRRAELHSGIPALMIRPMSQFDFLQQIGRAGRVKDGWFKNHGPALHELPAEPPPEVQNSSLEGLFIRLIAAGENPQELNQHFFHRIPTSHMQRTLKTLYNLNLIGPRGHVTSSGKETTNFPLNVRAAKILVEAQKAAADLGPKVLLNAIDIAAIIESEGIVRPDSKRKWIRFCRAEHDSDLIAQMRVFHKALQLPKSSFRRYGINPVAFQRACEIRKQLRRRTDMTDAKDSSAPMTAHEREALLESIWTGMIDSVFTYTGKSPRGESFYRATDGSGSRILSSNSVISKGKLVVGSPLNLGVLDSYGDQRIIPILFGASAVNPGWLEKHRPAQLKKVLDRAIKASKVKPKSRNRNVNVYPNPQRVRGGVHLG